MSYSRLSVTLESKVADELRQVAGPRGISAFVNEAVRQQLQAHRVRKMLDRMEAKAGPISDDVQQQVDVLPWPN